MTDSEPKPRQLHNLDAELGLLASLLGSPETLEEEAFPDLAADHFYDPFLGFVFEKIRTLHLKKLGLDRRILEAACRSHPGLASIEEAWGGKGSFFERLVDYDGGIYARGPMAIEYARIIIQLKELRLLRQAGTAMLQSIDEFEIGEDDPSALADYYEGVIADCRIDRADGKRVYSTREGARLTLKQMKEWKDNPPGMRTGLVDFDRKLGGLYPTDLVIIAGRPSMGKTALVTNIAAYLSDPRKPDPSVGAFFSHEMSREQLDLRLISTECYRLFRDGPSYSDLRQGRWNDLLWGEKIEQAVESLPDRLFVDDASSLTVAQIRARARKIKRRAGRLDYIVIDYLQIMDRDQRPGQNDASAIGGVTQGLKKLAKDLNCSVILLSQLSRQVEQRPDKRPRLSDLRESGAIEQDADVVLFCYREAYYLEREKPREDTPEWHLWRDQMSKIGKRMDVIIGKQRMGPIGTINLRFDGDRGLVESAAGDQYEQ